MSDFELSTYDALLVLTDLETDDHFALQLLCHSVAKDIPLLLITGEGQLNKTPLANALLATTPLTNWRTVQGDFSGKPYPEEALLVYGEDTKESDYGYARLVALSFLEKSARPLILCIKPPRELVDLPRPVLEKADLAIYGSFNLRSMAPYSWSALADWLNNSFRKVLLYESYYATGNENSLSKQNAPDLFSIIEQSTRKDWCALRRLSLVWNRHILLDCLQTMEELSGDYDSLGSLRGVAVDAPNVFEKAYVDMAASISPVPLYEKFVRKAKAARNILAAPDQIVLADFALVVLLQCPSLATLRCVTISFAEDTGYTRAIPEGNVHFATDVDQHRMIAYLTELVKSMQ